MEPFRRRTLRRAALLLALLPLSASAFAAMQADPVEWKVGDQVFSGVLVYDDQSSDRRPGLVMVPDWMGVTDAAVAQARDVAGDDYVILVADMYGKGVRPRNSDEAQAQVKTLYADPAAMRARAAKAVEVLKAQAGKSPLDASRIGAFGYCFGGSSVLELARSGAQLAGIVTFPKALELKEVATLVPSDRLLLETDSPFLAPVPYRGKRNEPAHVVRVAETVAALRGVAVAEVADTTRANFERLFGSERSDADSG